MKKPLLGNLFLLLSPLIWFGFSSVIVIFSSLYLLSHSKVANVVKEQLSTPVYSLFSSQPPVLGTSAARFKASQAKPLILEQYLARHHSPLSAFAQKMLDEAEKYNLPWTLLPAIAGQESTFCRTIPDNSYNCWGWAVHSTYTKRFSSFDEAIERVAKGLREDYFDRGLTTPSQIMTRYTPLSIPKGGTWAKGVEYFIWELETFSSL